MRVIKGRTILEDGWQRVEDDDPLPQGDVIVSWGRWNAERESLLARSGRLGVVVNGTTNIADVAADQAHFALIALEFPSLGDGRCYSHASLLRTRYGYTGELRAVGDVLRDQLFYMQRCGIDSYALRPDRSMEDALKAFEELSVKYQSAADGAPPIYKLRLPHT